MNGSQLSEFQEKKKTKEKKRKEKKRKEKKRKEKKRREKKRKEKKREEKKRKEKKRKEKRRKKEMNERTSDQLIDQSNLIQHLSTKIMMTTREGNGVLSSCFCPRRARHVIREG